jgi:hypothetical protein
MAAGTTFARTPFGGGGAHVGDGDGGRWTLGVGSPPGAQWLLFGGFEDCP